MGDGDRREKLTFSERDRLLRERRSGHDGRPRDAGAQAREAAATQRYLKELDEMFTPGGAEAERLAGEVRAAHGTPQLAGACRAYLEQVGRPADAKLLSLFLDCGDPGLIVAALEALRESASAPAPASSSGLRRQVRMLAEDSNDAIAEAAEELLELLEA